MKNASSIVCVLALSLAAAVLLAGSGVVDACKSLPTMAMEGACRKASDGGKEPLHGLCTQMLKTTPPRSEVTVYALEAVYAALDSYGATKRAMKNTSMYPPEFWAEVSECVGRYLPQAEQHVGEASSALEMCMLDGLKKDDFAGAVAAIEHCMTDLPPVLYGLASTARDRTVLAASLASLLQDSRIYSSSLA